MSDQEKSTGGQGDQPLVAPVTESQSASATGKVTKKKVAKKKAGKKKVLQKKVAKKKVVKKTVTKKKATVKKTAGKKKVAKKKVSRKKVAKKVVASGTAAREVEKQAVNNAILAAVSAGGDLMRPNAEALVFAEPTERDTEAEFGPEQREQRKKPAEEAAARQVEKRAVNDAILAAVDAGGSLMKPDTADKPSIATSGQIAQQAASGHTTLAEATEQEPLAEQTQVEEPAEAFTSLPEQAQSPARNEPKPVPVATPSQATVPAGVELPVELEKSQTHVAKPKHQGVTMRILLIALCLAAAVLYAKILVPDFDYAGLMPESAEETRTDDEEPAGLRPLPESQMQIIREVFAPELRQQ